MADKTTCPELVHLNVGPGWWPCGKPVAHSVLATSGRWEPRCDYHGMRYPEDRRRQPASSVGAAMTTPTTPEYADPVTPAPCNRCGQPPGEACLTSTCPRQPGRGA